MLERILPAGVAVAATDGDLDEELFEEEAAAVANAVESRRREFTTGRACARAALAQLGFPPQAIPAGENGAPLWPAGIVGSITHCEGFRASAVGRAAELTAIGIDAEPNRPLPDGVLADIALPAERADLRALAMETPEVCWDRLLFSIKESIYKAWFPLAQRWLGFEDAVVAIDRESDAFAARLLVPGPVFEGAPLRGFAGRWVVRDGIVLAAIALRERRDSKSTNIQSRN
jgi:4'-phosphopantetheinyl transferase EntD